ncbi:MAG TPA: hypothetical protein VGZ72_12265 [Stellaceae bacterium]|jgi:hypothetical protein|nr:hypothetical protein [Stellaceae bacterium]
MPTYRFYFLDGANHIQDAEQHDFTYDREAIENGPTMCAQRGEYVMEIWQGIRMVHRQKLTEPPSC